MKKVWMLFLLAAVFFSGKPIKSQVSTTPFSIKVVVNHNDNDDPQKKRITQSTQRYVESFLGELADVEVVEESPSFALNIIVVGPIRTDEPVLGHVPTVEDLHVIGPMKNVENMKKEKIVVSYVLTKPHEDSHDFIEHNVLFNAKSRHLLTSKVLVMAVDRALQKFR